MTSRAWVLYFGCLALVAGAWVVQLFVPPIVGLSDNGDFPREIGVFGYGPEQRNPPLKWSYVAPSYTPRTDFRSPEYELWTSHYLFVIAAIWISKVAPGNGTLPILLMGGLHAGAMLGALGRLFWVTRGFRGHVALWLGIAAVITDVGYASYANSFFREAGSGVFAVWVVAEAIAVGASRQVWLGFLVPALLLICAKLQNAPLAIPLMLFVMFAGWRSRFWERTAMSALMVGAGVCLLSSVGARPKLETSYNMLFSSLLPESRDPRGDLRALGMDPELVRFKGTLAWSPGSGLAEPKTIDAVQQLAGPARITAFYLARPTRLWRHMTTLFPVATQLRAESCGNFEAAAGRAPGARATRFSFWSGVHERVLGRMTKYLLFGLVAMMATGVCLWNRWQMGPVLALLPALALTAFVTAAFGDANEPVKHQYLFNLLLDGCLLCLVSGAAGWVRTRL